MTSSIRMITFTESTGGAQLYARSAPNIKKLALELGGNTPFIVSDDADVDAVDGDHRKVPKTTDRHASAPTASAPRTGSTTASRRGSPPRSPHGRQRQCFQ